MRELKHPNKNPNTRVFAIDEPEFNAHHKYVVTDKKGDPGKEVDYTDPAVECIRQHINFQKGPVKEHGINGIQHEDLLHVLIDRVKSLNHGAYECVENRDMLYHLNQALKADHDRTAKRETRGVEGTSKK